MSIKVSVITVCLNALRELPQTMLSIREQSYINTESIVIDGGSTDGTLDYLKSLDPPPTVLISEKDKGIYDAMNKGIAAATGEYIIFMNAGDSFRHKAVLMDIFSDEYIVNQRPKIISGRVQFAVNDELLDCFRPLIAGPEGPGLPHQATFIDADLHKRNLFDPRYRYVGDYELWCRLKQMDLFKVYFISQTVAIFSFGGASTSVKADSMRYLERAFVDASYNGRFPIQKMLCLAITVAARRLMFSLLPARIYYIFLRKAKGRMR